MKYEIYNFKTCDIIGTYSAQSEFEAFCKVADSLPDTSGVSIRRVKTYIASEDWGEDLAGESLTAEEVVQALIKCGLITLTEEE